MVCSTAPSAAARIMSEQGHGCIINTASTGGIVTTPGMAVYCALKSAVISLTKVTSIEVAASGVRVNSISPGTMLTGMVSDPSAEVLEMLDKLQPIDARPSQRRWHVVFCFSHRRRVLCNRARPRR